MFKLGSKTLVTAACLLLCGCNSVDYSQMPFYDDFFGEEPPKISGPRRQPSTQPNPMFKDYKKPIFNKGYYKEEPGITAPGQQQGGWTGDHDSDQLADHTNKTDMYAVGPGADPTLFSDGKPQLKAFEYQDTPKINAPITQSSQGTITSTPPKEIAESRSFSPEPRYNPQVIDGGYVSKTHYGNSYFKNQ